MNDFRQQFRTAVRAPGGDALESFMLLDGRYSNFTKETFFLRYAGGQGCAGDIDRLRAWAGQGGRGGRAFEPALRSQIPAGEAARYVELYGGGRVRFPFRFENQIWQEALEEGFRQIMEQFRRVRGRSEDAILRNFAVKILCWIDTYFPVLFTETVKMDRFPKFACGGTVKLAGYLFLYLLFLLGCDVLYISPTGEAAVEDRELLELSLPVKAAPPAPAPRPVERERREAPRGGRPTISLDAVRRPERDRPAPGTPPRGPVPASAGGARQPLEFEELARSASSVVMLKVFDDRDQCFKTGSGVIVSDKGYVLTNLHVVNGGRYYGILLEEETDIFYTSELIKYHQDFDLAVLRMEKRRKPIPISDGTRRLVRGQKVVAIGSPLGLFNSVSDGIISGFRDMEKVSMIQFTAPVSHGSSGGALLDMYGDLIGLITAGYDDGQNLNLAVDCQTIARFVRGLV